MIDKTWAIISALKKIDTKKRNGKSEVSIKLEQENLLRRIICFCKRYINADCTSKFIWFLGLSLNHVFSSKVKLENDSILIRIWSYMCECLNCIEIQIDNYISRCFYYK